MDIYIWLAISSAFGFIAFRIKWLTVSGSLAASTFGFCILNFGGMQWLIPLIVFFGTSSILSKVGKKPADTDAESSPDDIRSALQVLANGGVAWLCLMLNAWEADTTLYVAYVGSIAAVTADTWGTECGRLFGGTTRSILTGRVVSKGTSGGLSVQGTLGGVVGAALIGFIGSLYLAQFEPRPAAVICLAGVLGSGIDSLLGASVQARFVDERTGGTFESKHVHNEHLKLKSGWAWMTNETVNLLCASAGGSSAVYLLNG